MIDAITQLPPLLLYPALFIGLIFLAGFVLLPAMYLSITGAISLWGLLLVTILAGIAADSIWYFVGKKTSKEKMYSWKYIRTRVEEAKQFSAFFERHGVSMVFLTKFVYGTRLASHILAGMHAIRYISFVAATAAGTTLWFFIFYFLIYSVDAGISSTKAVAFRIELLFLIIVVFVILINFLTKKYLKKRFQK